MINKLFLDLNNFKANLGGAERGDSIELNIKLLNSQDYSNSKFRLLGAKSDGKFVEQIEGMNLDEQSNLKIILEEQFVNCEGIVKMELNVVSRETETTTKEFYFFVSNTMNGEIVESADSIPTLEKVSKYVDDAVNNLDALKEASEDITIINSEFKENEIKRKANEMLREKNEKARLQSEDIRITEEEEREANELERIKAENNRKVSERNRKVSENTRVTNERAREEAELSRQSTFEENEEIRNENENLRIASEKERIKFNSEAKNDELNRKESEKNRVLAEEERKSSEESRVAAEAIRQNTYTDFNESEEERKSNEIKRQEAEALRIEAETRRDSLFSEKEEERNTSFIESEKVRNAAFNKAQDSRNTVFEESETVREEAFKISEKARNDAEELRVEAENNRSSNIKQIRELVSSGSMKITFNERDGYLTVNGSFNHDNRLHCKVTNKIYCEEGWVFNYYGRAEDLAISYIMYQGDSIKSTGQHNRVLTEVVIPEGVDSIVFSSFCEKEKEVDLRVSLVKPDILLKDNLMKSLESKLGIVELNNQIRDSLSYDNFHIYKEDMTKISNFYANSAGNLVAANNYACYELTVAEGDIYYYSGTIIYNLAPYHLCNSQNEVVEVGGDLKQHPTLTPFEYDFLIIPKGVTKLRVCSGGAGGDAKLSLFKKNLKAPITQNEISDMLNNHEYDGVGEYADVTSRYSIINGSYINSGGSLSKDAESQCSDYIDITNISSLYIDAHAKYSTRAMGIYDGDKMFLGLKGVPDTQNVVLWKKEPIIIANLKKEYPSVRFIRVSSYQYNTYPIKIYEQKCNLVETVKYLESKIESIKISSNVLYGKKYVACGDSFTEGDFRGFVDENGLTGTNSPVIYDEEMRCYKTYPWWIAKRNNMALVNEAICGSTMALSKEYLDGTNTDINYRSPFSLKRYKQVPLDADYLTLWFGLNETSTPLGTLQDTDNRTILGAWNIVLEYFITNMPYCKIGIVISDGYLNDTFANGIISVAEYWGIPYLDLRNDPKVPLMLGGRGGNIKLNPKARELRNKAFYVTASNGHPNLKAHEYQSTFIENWLRSL